MSRTMLCSKMHLWEKEQRWGL